MNRWLFAAGVCAVAAACSIEQEGAANVDHHVQDAAVDYPGDIQDGAWPDHEVDATDAPLEALDDQTAPDVMESGDAPDGAATDAAGDTGDGDAGSDANDGGCQSPGGLSPGFRFRWYSAAGWHQTRLDAEIDVPPLGTPDVPWTQAICTDTDTGWNVWDCYIAPASLPCGSEVRLNVLIDDGTASGTLMCNTQTCLGYPGEYAFWNGGQPIPSGSASIEAVQPCEAGPCLHRLLIKVP